MLFINKNQTFLVSKHSAVNDNWQPIGHKIDRNDFCEQFGLMDGKRNIPVLVTKRHKTKN